ncbi:MAG: hypothetical protein ACXW3G_02625 [Rhodoplanes sp.]
MIELVVDTVGNEWRELGENFPDRSNTNVLGGMPEGLAARRATLGVGLTLRRIAMAAAAGDFQAASGAYAEYRGEAIAAGPPRSRRRPGRCSTRQRANAISPPCGISTNSPPSPRRERIARHENRANLARFGSGHVDLLNPSTRGSLNLIETFITPVGSIAFAGQPACVVAKRGGKERKRVIFAISMVVALIWSQSR